MTGQRISLNVPDGNFSGYLASPASGQGPGIVVIQEIFGINQVMRDICDGLAARGFFALAPDLFWRLQPDIALTDQTEAEWNQAFALMNRFDQDKGVEDIQAAITHLRALPDVSGKVGTVGYCLGGLLAYLAAARTDTDASVGYYGVSIQDRLDEVIAHPLMLHLAEADAFTPPEAQAKIMAGLKDNPQITLHSYPQMDHAFARVGSQHYDHACADLANSRTASFFRQHLG